MEYIVMLCDFHKVECVFIELVTPFCKSIRSYQKRIVAVSSAKNKWRPLSLKCFNLCG